MLKDPEWSFPKISDIAHVQETEIHSGIRTEEVGNELVLKN